MSHAIAMVLAGGRVDELGVLTLRRPKSAVPFAGPYRIIDFVLTNLMRSGIDQVGVLSQYRPAALIEHIGGGTPWGLAGRRRGVRILPPFAVEGGGEWYRGTADAVHQNLHFIEAHRPDHVLILSGDHVYSMDYRPLLALHEESGADLTMAFKPVPIEGAHRFGIGSLDAGGRVVAYDEKPARPASNLASLTIYAFRTEALIDRLRENARTGHTHQLYSEVIPRMVEARRVQGYVFEGYWEYARTVDAYYQAHMDLVADPSPIDLACWAVRTNPVTTRPGDAPPTRIGKDARVVGSVVGAGCVIEGHVEDSVLSPYVTVEAGARVVRSVLIHESTVERDAIVEEAILDKWARASPGVVIGQGDRAVPCREIPASLSSGVTVLGRGSRSPPGLRIGKNCMVYPNTAPEAFGGRAVPDGSVVK